MAEERQYKGIEKKGYVATFKLIGEVKLNDFSFKIDNKSQNNADYIYSQLNLSLNCGEKSGYVTSRLMGGYFNNGSSKIYARKKNSDGKDDYTEDGRIVVAWEDRNDLEIINQIGNNFLTSISIEKKQDGSLFTKKFLSEYDAISYLKEHLRDGMIVKIYGNVEYQIYNGNIIINRHIKSIVLQEDIGRDKFEASFTQTFLLTSDSYSKKSVNTDKSVLEIEGYILEYNREYTGNIPIPVKFEYKVDFKNKKKTKKIINSLFVVEDDSINQITFLGNYVQNGMIVNVTLDDIPEDIKELIELGVYTEEEVLSKAASNGSKEQIMMITKPQTLKTEDNSLKIAKIDNFMSSEEFYNVLKDSKNLNNTKNNKTKIKNNKSTDNNTKEKTKEEINKFFDIKVEDDDLDWLND